MPVNWNDKDVLERLFIAALASLDNKININEVARIYGEDMTYHALENRMRRYKKEATTLKDEAADREGAVKSPMKTRTKKSDAGSPKGAVKTGRITKKATTATKIKSEPLVGEELLHGMGEEAVGDDEAVDETDEFV